MKIISHRGCWKSSTEKNNKKSFIRAFKLGFGVETDIRDYKGDLVISHDIANQKCIKFSDFCKVYNECNLPLALNIKSDGLQVKLKQYLTEFNITNYFVFDMSIPDTYIYLKHKINVFTRQSEFEKEPAFYRQAKGIWLDCFEHEWFTEKEIKKHSRQKKPICIVSPELHNREYLKTWQKLKKWTKPTDTVYLCTDYPEKAKAFFL